jgi:hypothetical protein
MRVSRRKIGFVARWVLSITTPNGKPDAVCVRVSDGVCVILKDWLGDWLGVGVGEQIVFSA